MLGFLNGDGVCETLVSFITLVKNKTTLNNIFIFSFFFVFVFFLLYIFSLFTFHAYCVFFKKTYGSSHKICFWCRTDNYELLFKGYKLFKTLLFMFSRNDE